MARVQPCPANGPPNSPMHITAMDYTRAAILNALHEGMTLDDLWRASEHAATPQDFDRAVNTLAQTQGAQHAGPTKAPNIPDSP